MRRCASPRSIVRCLSDIAGFGQRAPGDKRQLTGLGAPGRGRRAAVAARRLVGLSSVAGAASPVLALPPRVA